MDYKRSKQIKDDDINVFKEIEINKIMSNTEVSKPKHLFKYKYYYVSLVLMIAITLAAIGLTGNNDVPFIPSGPYIQDEYFTVEKINDQTFEMLTTTENTYMEFYYNGYIVYENDFTIIGDYQYNQRYREVPQEVKDQIAINFDAFSIGEHKYFLEIEVEGETRIFYIEVYGNRSFSTYINGFEEAVDFEETINDIFELIEQYPPVFVEEKYGKPSYAINENIAEINNETLIAQYTTFVERYYIADDYFTFEEPEYTTIITYDNVVVLDENNEIISMPSYTSTRSTQSVGLQENEVSFLTRQTKFYPVDTLSLGLQTMPISQVDENITGNLAEFIHEDQKHAYIVIYKDYSIDLEDVDYVEVTYKIKAQFQTDPQTESITLDVIHYSDALLVEAYAYSEYLETYSTSVFWEYNVTFYDADGNQIYDLEIK